MTTMPTNNPYPGVINNDISRILASTPQDYGLAPAEPFVWGQGGQQLSPETLAIQRQLAESMAAPDFSPVQHWTQGLGRVFSNAIGARNLNRLDAREKEANASVAAELARAFGPGNEDLARIATSGNRGAASLADNIYKQRNPTPQQPTEWERALIASGVQPGTPGWQQANATKVQNTLDPWTSLVSGGESLMGRQSQVQRALMGGGGPVSPGAGIPSGSSLDSGAPVAIVDVIQDGGKTYYKFADGKVYDNPERR